jgi:cell division septal protein FtsQ
MVRWTTTVGLLGIAVFGIYDLVKYMTQSDFFMVRDVRIQGCYLLSEVEILGALDVPAQVRLWRVEPEKLEARLLESSFVRMASVHRVLPQTLVVDIAERNPIVDWKDPRTGKVFAVDEEGVVLCELLEMQERLARISPSPGERARRPMLTGLDTGGETPGNRLSAPGLERVLSAFGLAASREESWVEMMTEVEAADNGYGWVLHCPGRNRQVRLGNRNFIERIGRVEPVWRFLEKEGIETAYIDLRFEEQGVLIKPVNIKSDRWLEIASRYPTTSDKDFGSA